MYAIVKFISTLILCKNTNRNVHLNKNLLLLAMEKFNLSNIQPTFELNLYLKVEYWERFFFWEGEYPLNCTLVYLHMFFLPFNFIFNIFCLHFCVLLEITSMLNDFVQCFCSIVSTDEMRIFIFLDLTILKYYYLFGFKIQLTWLCKSWQVEK